MIFCIFMYRYIHVDAYHYLTHIRDFFFCHKDVYMIGIIIMIELVGNTRNISFTRSSIQNEAMTVSRNTYSD